MGRPWLMGWLLSSVVIGGAASVSAQNAPPKKAPAPAAAKKEDAPPAPAPAPADKKEPAAPAPGDKKEPAPATPATPATPAAPVDPNSPAGVFQAKFAAFKEIIKKLRDLNVKFQIAEPAEADAIRKQYAELVVQGQKMEPELKAAAAAAYSAAPNADRETTRFLIKLVADEVRRDAYESAATLIKPLLDNKCDEKDVPNLAGIIAFCTNDFAAAETYLKQAETAKTLSQQGRSYLPDVVKYKDLWAKEQSLRAQEMADAADPEKALPRVKIKTEHGDITVELFENQAPGTVGNFVNLVEGKKYDGLNFHRVLPQFMAQGGDPNGDGTGGPGYNIYCECAREDARMHFRGVLSMAHAGKDTGGSQFFITFVPTTQLNSKHTVFGRVVEGMDVLSLIKRRNPEDPKDQAIVPSKIVSAEVLNKRKHEYVPNKVPAAGTPVKP